MNYRKYKIILPLFLSVFIVIALVLYYNNRMQQKQIKVIYVSKNADTSDFWSALVAGANMAVKEYELDFTIMAPEEEEDYKRQNELIYEAITKNPDAIVLSPGDYEKTLEAAKEITNNDIRLVLVDSLLKEDVADCVITTNNEKAGEIMGKYARELCGENIVVGVVSHVKGSSTAIEREKGVSDVLNISANLEDVVYSDSQYRKAYEVTKGLMEKSPNINVLICLNEYSTVGAARVIHDMGLDKKVKIIGFDNSLEEIKFLEQGVIDGIVIQKPFDMGYLGIVCAVKLVKGELVEKEMDSGAKLITKENIYTEENQKLLFPFWRE